MLIVMVSISYVIMSCPVYFLCYNVLSSLSIEQPRVVQACKANILTPLRTVPTIVIAHTFCASQDTRISYR